MGPLGESCINNGKINNEREDTKQDARTHEEQQSNERQRLADDENHHVYAGRSVIQPQKKETRREGCARAAQSLQLALASVLLLH